MSGIDLKNLKRHYASLSDDALLAIGRDDLVEGAQACYDEELAARGLAAEGLEDDETGVESDEPAPDWLEESAVACTFMSQPGNPAAPETEHAREVLEEAGIPCHVALNKIEPPAQPPQPRYEYRLMVPSELSMHASSVLDKELFNIEVEHEWKAYFESLSDDEFRAADPEELFAGLRDKLERATRAYEAARSERGLASE